MTNADIAHQRLHNQHLAGAPLATPEAVVQWLGAVQAQDYLAAQWALGLRLAGARDTDIDQAFAAGTILRTHVMRPTWHFVAPADIRWLLALTAPRVHAANASIYRRLAMTEAEIVRSQAALASALQGGRQLTRPELGTVLERAGIATQGELRLGYFLMRAELDGLICSGGRRGKQFTYALLEERAPAARMLPREEALAELTRRYFTSHGPATLKDYRWWSGLTLGEAKTGLELVKSHLMPDVIEGQTYWRAESPPFVRDPAPTAYLLPNYDEFTIGYTGHDPIYDAQGAKDLDPEGRIYYGHAILLDGRIVGAWKRTLRKGGVLLTFQPLAPFSEAEQRAVATAARRYGAFLGLPVILP
jgi:hypothetical protein